MYAQTITRPVARPDRLELAIRAAAVMFALVTAYIHSTLGGLLFTLNAIGFLVFAVGLLAPIGIVVGARYAPPLRLLVRLGLLGFSAATIIGWVLIGARIAQGYEATTIEVILVVLMAVDIGRTTGGPISVVRELLLLVPARLRPTV